MLYDNEAIRRACSSHNNNMPTFSLDDHNRLISRCMLGQTACDRFSSQLSIDLRKIAMNGDLFRESHFFLPAVSLHQEKSPLETIREVAVNFGSESMNLLASADLKKGRLISLTSLFRGKELPTWEIVNQMKNLKNRISASNLCDFIPNNFLVGVCDVPEKDLSNTVTFLSNSTAVRDIFTRLTSKFEAARKRKVFTHCYLSLRMDDLEFDEALENLKDNLRRYEYCHDPEASEENEEEEEEENGSIDLEQYLNPGVDLERS